MTLYEAWSGRKPGVAHLKVFGCIAYAHVPDEKRRKLDHKSVKCIFIGYCEETKTYRMYNAEPGKMLVSHDMFFDEKEEWQWNQGVKQENPRIIIQEYEYFVPTNMSSSPSTYLNTSTH